MTKKIKQRNMELVEEFFKEFHAIGRSKKTIATYRCRINFFLKFLDGKSLWEVSREDIKDFIIYMKNSEIRRRKQKDTLSKKTQECYLVALKSLFETLIIMSQEEEIPEKFTRNPLRKLIFKTNGKSRRRALSVEEISAMVNTTFNPQHKAIIMTFFKTGVRSAELVGIDYPDDVNFDEKELFIQKGKGGRERFVFIDDECIRLLKRYINNYRRANNGTRALFVGERGKRIQPKNVVDLVRSAAIATGLDSVDSRYENRITPHVFRHSFTTALRERKCDSYVILKLRGDNDANMLDYYSHYSKDHMRDEYLQHIPRLGV